MTQGYVEGRGRLGVTVLSDGAGLKIQSIEEGSDLYGKAEKGDYILAADGVELASMDDLYLVLAGHSAGDSVKLKIFDVSENITFQEDVRLLPDKGETQALSLIHIYLEARPFGLALRFHLRSGKASAHHLLAATAALPLLRILKRGPLALL